MESVHQIRSERQRHARYLESQLLSGIDEVLQKYPVDAAYLFGSVAKRQAMPTSDVDVAVLFSGTLDPAERLQTELQIQADLEDVCGLPAVDVRSINSMPIMVQGPIIQAGLLVYEADRAKRIAFEVLTRKKYFDYRPTAEKMQKAFLAHVQQRGLLGDRS